MDNIFGIGLPEILVILIIAGLVMGPERIMKSARWAGYHIARLQAYSRKFVRQMNAELDSLDPSGELQSTTAELQKMRQQMEELKKDVMSVATAGMTNVQAAQMSINRPPINSILPPDLRTLHESAIGETNDRGRSGAKREHPANDNGRSSTTLPDTAQPSSPPKLPKRIEIVEDSDI